MAEMVIMEGTAAAHKLIKEKEAHKVAVANADGEKCERCWRWEPSVGSHDEHATLCTRCVEAVS